MRSDNNIELKYKNKPRLGILGGMGALASSVFYQRLTIRVGQFAKCDQDHIDLILWSDCSMPDRTACILSGDDSDLLSRCEEDFQILARAGCDAICFPCNTLHHFFDKLEKLSPVPLLNMVELTMKYLSNRRNRPQTIQILGTEGTRKSHVYREFAEKYGLKIIDVSDEDQNNLSQYIYELKNTGRTDFPGLSRMILNNHSRFGIDCFVLACTEISCMNLSHDAQLLTFDAMDALVTECINIFGPKY